MRLSLFYKISFILVFISVVSYGQKSTYKDKFIEGSYLVLEENYTRALENFLIAYNIDSVNSNINFCVGFCYLQIATDKKKALPYLEKAVLNASEKYNSFEPKETNAPVTSYFYLGQAYHLNYRFDEAITNLEKFKTYLKPKQLDLIKDTERQIEMCKNGKEYLALPTNISITNMGDSVNSIFPDYSPLISADESMLIFTSRRDISTGGLKTFDDQYYEDIYVCYRNRETNSWSSPVSIGANINTNGHEATVGLSADGQQLLIYKDDDGDGNIYLSTLDGDVWSAPVKMGSDINTLAWEPSACLSADGTTIYFVSDRKDGLGGRDIYRCVRLPNGEWSKALNLGPTINTEFDEDAPFIHPSGNTLFFSSNGHKTMGGFDIFYSTKMADNAGWTEPTNLLYPINTTEDDIFYVSSTDGKRAYYSSFKSDSKGERDIYLISLEEGTKVDPVALVIGKLIADEGTQIPSNTEIIITDLQSNESKLFKPNIKTGKYILPLIPGKSYSISYRIGEQEFLAETLEIPTGSSYQEIDKEIFLDPVNLKGRFTKAIAESQKLAKDSTASENKTKNTIKNELKENSISNNTKNEEKKEPILKQLENKTKSDEAVAKSYNESVYKIQIAAVKKPAAPDAFKGLNNIEYEQTENGFYKYYIGNYKEYAEAKKKKLEISENGYKDAFIVNYKGALLPFEKSGKRSGLRASSEELNSLTKLTNTDFTMYFKYNVVELSTKDNDYLKFIENIITKLNNEKKVTISVLSSASYVPTREYKDNKELAAARGEDAKNKLIASLKEKGIDVTKIIFSKVKSSVNGPRYKNDYQINKSEYEQHQYVKILIDK